MVAPIRCFWLKSLGVQTTFSSSTSVSFSSCRLLFEWSILLTSSVCCSTFYIKFSLSDITIHKIKKDCLKLYSCDVLCPFFESITRGRAWPNHFRNHKMLKDFLMWNSNLYYGKNLKSMNYIFILLVFWYELILHSDFIQIIEIP